MQLQDETWEEFVEWYLDNRYNEHCAPPTTREWVEMFLSWEDEVDGGDYDVGDLLN